MRASAVAVLFLAVVVIALFPIAARSQPPPRGGLEVTGPFTHENLTIFLFHNPGFAARPDHKVASGYLSLEEALDRKQVVIFDDGNVNRLWAQNNGKAPIYMQGGDIVKGGRQDRVLEHDTILAPDGKKVALAAFCVEHGRWQARGSEPSRTFGSSKNTLVTRKQKLAAKAEANQSAVWDSVAEAQATIGSKLGAPVKAAQSESSLQLSLENERLRKAAERFVAALDNVAARRGDTVGYAFAVNGEISAADIYGAPVLFKKLWPKLLRASAVEAVAEQRPGAIAAVTADAVKEFVAGAEKGNRSERKVSPRTSVEKRDSREAVMFDTSDAEMAAPVHRNFLRK
jgi:hypothetical protein